MEDEVQERQVDSVQEKQQVDPVQERQVGGFLSLQAPDSRVKKEIFFEGGTEVKVVLLAPVQSWVMDGGSRWILWEGRWESGGRREVTGSVGALPGTTRLLEEGGS